MRYLWLIFFLFIVGIGSVFVYQNQEPVAVHFALDWINFDLGINRTPLFIPILIALAFGMATTTAYLFFYHAYLQLKIRSQSSEIYRLKKLVILEREKNKKNKQISTHQLNGSKLVEKSLSNPDKLTKIEKIEESSNLA